MDTADCAPTPGAELSEDLWEKYLPLMYTMAWLEKKRPGRKYAFAVLADDGVELVSTDEAALDALRDRMATEKEWTIESTLLLPLTEEEKLEVTAEVMGDPWKQFNKLSRVDG